MNFFEVIIILLVLLVGMAGAALALFFVSPLMLPLLGIVAAFWLFLFIANFMRD